MADPAGPSGGRTTIACVNRRRFYMKRAITLVLAAFFGLSLIGCHASIDTDTDKDSHYKKTTTYDRNGNVTTEEKKTTTY
jgi:hypothetical protein